VSEQSNRRRYTYRNLDVWNRSQEMAVEVIRLVRRLPRNDDAVRVISRQVIAAAGSVGANIAEGHGRMTRRAYRQYLVISRGSASEVGSWLDLLKRLELLAEEQESPLQDELDSLIGVLTYKIRSLAEADTAPGKGTIREESSVYITDSEASPGTDEFDFEEIE